jgi:hypothetical protein
LTGLELGKVFFFVLANSSSLLPIVRLKTAPVHYLGQPFWGGSAVLSNSAICSTRVIDFTDNEAADEHAFFAWQDPYYAIPGNPFLGPNGIDSNSYGPEVLLPAFDPTIFDKPYNNGRYLCNVPGCESTFTRLGDRNRHVKSKHDKTPHFCLISGCEKSFERGGKGYTRQDKLQEHMQKKHAATGEAAV